MTVTDYEPDFTWHFKPLYSHAMDKDEELTTMYAFNSPANSFWHGVAYYLHALGASDEQIREIMASKHARWMMDGYDDKIAELGEEIAGEYFKAEIPKL